MAARLPKSFYARTLAKAYPADHTYKLALYEVMPSVDMYSRRGECTGEGYEAGGLTLTGYRIVERKDGADLAFNTQNDWFNATIKAIGAVVYDADTGDIIAMMDFGRFAGVIGGIFTVNLNKDGVAGIGTNIESDL